MTYLKMMNNVLFPQYFHYRTNNHFESFQLQKAHSGLMSKLELFHRSRLFYQIISAHYSMSTCMPQRQLELLHQTMP